MAWKRPDKRRVRAIRDRLREMYGQPVNEPHGHPIAELVKTVLSQHTNDRNRDRAFAALRERFPTWEEVRDAPVGRGRGGDPARRPRQAEGAADPGDPRAARRAAGPRLDRDGAARGVARVPPGAAGVGRKTAACVLIFTWGIPEIPVDVHVHRVGGRLGLFPAQGLLRAGPRRDAGDRRPRGRLRAAHEPDPPRARALPPEAALRGVRAAADVPLVPRRAGAPVVSPPPVGGTDPGAGARHLNEQAHLHRLRAPGPGPRGRHPLARFPLQGRRRDRRAGGRRQPEGRPVASSRPTAAPATRSTRPAPTATTARTSTNCWRPRARRPAAAPRRRSRRPKAASSTRSKTASTAPRPRAGCRPASSTGSRPEEVAEFVANTAGEG